ncbi:MAG: hypothetical protein JNK89_08125 [Saprospiraceae bacterium]|nr:hypothetical protein [Saprospiraceae bacterium]
MFHHNHSLGENSAQRYSNNLRSRCIVYTGAVKPDLLNALRLQLWNQLFN